MFISRGKKRDYHYFNQKKKHLQMIFSVIIKAHAGMRPKAQKETVEQMKDHTANSTQSISFFSFPSSDSSELSWISFRRFRVGFSPRIS